MRSLLSENTRHSKENRIAARRHGGKGRAAGQPLSFHSLHSFHSFHDAPIRFTTTAGENETNPSALSEKRAYHGTGPSEEVKQL
jgi:hypothetical protein